MRAFDPMRYFPCRKLISVYNFSIKVDHERENASVLRKNLKFTKERYHSTENMLGKKYLSIELTR